VSVDLKKVVLIGVIIIFFTFIVACSLGKSAGTDIESKETTSTTETFQESPGEELSSSQTSDSEMEYQKLKIIPLEITETLDYIDPPFPVEGRKSEITGKADPGWKFLNISIAFENPTKDFVGMSPSDSLPSIKVKTEQGYSYELDEVDPLGWNAILPFPFEGRAVDLRIPGGFRITGERYRVPVTDDYFELRYYFRFKVAEKSSGYKLLVAGFPEIDLSRQNKELAFPTDLPESSFYKLGEQLAIQDKGSISIIDFKRDSNSNEAVLKIKYINASEGYQQKFNLAYSIIGNDGILSFSSGKDFPFDYTAITVGPGQKVEAEERFFLPSYVNNAKLIITGDIEVVVNLE